MNPGARARFIMQHQPSQPFAARQLRDGKWSDLTEPVTVEEPLEIRIGGRRYSATMRTPQGEANDRLLALGLLLTEGVIASVEDVDKVSLRTRCRELNDELVSVADVTLWDDSQLPQHLWERNLISNSSCGLCGKATVEALSAQVSPLSPRPLDAALLQSLPDKMRAQQTIFSQTGGLHAAAIFNQSGDLLACFEDIGRHNATDRAIGCGLEQGWIPSADDLILLVSGRVSFEIVQKALRARIGTVAGVSAASSLAIQLAARNHLNLVGWMRARGLTVYCGETAEVGS